MELQSIPDAERAEPMAGVTAAPLLTGERANVQQFRIEPGVETSPHSHPHEQLIVVFGGKLTIETPDRTATLGPRETCLLPGGESHAAANRGNAPAEGFDDFSPPRPDAEAYLDRAE